jgi:hypothetical protein
VTPSNWFVVSDPLIIWEHIGLNSLTIIVDPCFLQISRNSSNFQFHLDPLSSMCRW